MNKKSLIIAIIALIILTIFAWQLTLIVLGVIALLYAINLIKQDYAYPDSYDHHSLRRNTNSEDVSLDFLKQDKEIKDPSRFEERDKRMSKSIKTNKNKKHNNNHNYSSNSNHKNNNGRNDKRNNNYHEDREYIKEKEYREREEYRRPSNNGQNKPKRKRYEDEPLISPGLKKALIFFSIVFAIMIIFIFIVALKQNSTPFEVPEEEDPLVMTDEEREAYKEKKAKEEEDRKKAKEDKEKAEEERLKAEEEKKALEEQEKENEENVSSEPIDTPSIVTSDVYQNE